MEDVKTKICTKCGEEKNIRSFYRHSGYKCGYMPVCKKCKPKGRKFAVVSEIKVKDNGEVLKKCLGCGIEKSIIAFTKSKNGVGGVASRCKTCDKLYRKVNKDKIKQGNDLYYNKIKKRGESKYKEHHLMQKICAKCGGEKKLTEFHKSAASKDGAKACCKECIKIKTKRYNEKYREEKKRRDTLYYQTNKIKILEQIKGYREKNKDKIRLRKEQYHSDGISGLSDWYIHTALYKTHGLKYDDITPDMRDSKRRYLKYYRELKQLKQQQNETK